MSREEVKSKIHELLEDTPESVLNEVLDYLNSVKDSSSETINLSQNMRRILTEDKQLLERLAK